MHDAIATHGYHIVPQVLTDSEVLTFRELLEGISHTSTRDICSYHPAIAELADTIGERLAGGLPCVRSLFFDKTPERNWPVAWHQDLTIAVIEKREVEGYGPWSTKEDVVHVQPPIEVLEGMISLRVHLDEVDAKNGPLSVVPKSHLQGKIESENIATFTQNRVVPCLCDCGDVLMMSPLILHSSPRAKNPSHRRVLHFEYAEKSLLSDELAWRW